MNSVQLIGRLGADPEIKNTSGGNTIARLRLATNSFKKEGDQWVDHTDWHNVTLFGRQAEIARDYLSKGREVGIEGRIEYREHEGKWYTSIVASRMTLIGSKGEQSSGSSGGGYASKPIDDVPF